MDDIITGMVHLDGIKMANNIVKMVLLLKALRDIKNGLLMVKK